jgi:hypothetical protein
MVMAVRSRLRDIVIDCARPSALAAFWAEVLGYRVAPYDEVEIARLKAAGIHDIADDPSVMIEPPDGGPRICFVLVPEPKTAKNRVHLDVNLRSGETLDWLVSLGATVVRPIGATAGPDGVVLLDPEGNEFCAFLPDA